MSVAGTSATTVSALRNIKDTVDATKVALQAAVAALTNQSAPAEAQLVQELHDAMLVKSAQLDVAVATANDLMAQA